VKTIFISLFGVLSSLLLFFSYKLRPADARLHLYNCRGKIACPTHLTDKELGTRLFTSAYVRYLELFTNLPKMISETQSPLLQKKKWRWVWSHSTLRCKVWYKTS